MHWLQIVSNIVGVVAGCAALQFSGVTGEPVSARALLMAVVMCVLANQVGLHQEKP